MIRRLGVPRFWIVTALLADLVVVSALSVGVACAAIVVGGLVIRLRTHEPFVAALAVLAALPVIAAIQPGDQASSRLATMTVALILLGCGLLVVEHRRELG